MDALFNSSNVTTGSNSTNTANLGVNSSSLTNVSNISSTSNNMNFSVDTGTNAASNNTKVGNVMTGGIDINLDVTTKDNGNGTAVSVPVGGSVTIMSTNSNTGVNSTNTTTVTKSSSNSVSVTNNSSVHNSVSASVSTGGNTVNGNTAAGNLTTGGAHINVLLTNSSNGGDTNAPVNPFIPGVDEPIYDGVGGDFLPLPTITLAAVTPEYDGAGGGYFAAGASLGSEIVWAVLAAAVISYGVPALRKGSSSLHRITISAKGTHA